MPIFIAPGIRKKLTEKHAVSEDEVRQCFENIEGGYLRDTREQHDTDPPTYWFVSETNRRRKLKIAFVAREVETPNGKKVRVEIKTAYPANDVEIDIYTRRGKCE